MVAAEPAAECSPSQPVYSRQARGSLFWSCTRDGPDMYLAAKAAMPSVSIRSAMASHSVRKRSTSCGRAP